MACELGGKRPAQLVAAAAAAIAGVPFASGAMFQYVSFDYLWLGADRLSDYSIPAFARPALVGGDWSGDRFGRVDEIHDGVFCRRNRGRSSVDRCQEVLAEPWLWCGVAISVLIFLPNLTWQMLHNFISLDDAFRRRSAGGREMGRDAASDACGCRARNDVAGNGNRGRAYRRDTPAHCAPQFCLVANRGQFKGNFHYEFGWREMTDAVARVRDSLPTRDTARGAAWRSGGRRGRGRSAKPPRSSVRPADRDQWVKFTLAARLWRHEAMATLLRGP
jgi:hypothetical protein